MGGTRRLVSVPAQKSLVFDLPFFLIFRPLALSRDAEEKKEEKKRRKRRKTGQTTPGPKPASTAAPAAPLRTAGEEEDRASTDAQPAAGATTAPNATEPPSAGGTPETTGAAPAVPAIASTTTSPEAPPARTAAPPSSGTAPEPSSERRMTSTEQGPSRATSPPLPKILGRPARITAEPHAADPWARVLATMTGALHDEVVRARATEEACIDEGWALLHQATERCHLLD
jgi:hypothetical protein